MKAIFTYNEIIAIVMEELKQQEEKEMYGIENNAYDLPIVIKNKMDSLSSEEYKEFINHIEYISHIISDVKTGELNELNNCSSEIIYNIDKKWIKKL